jgi:hypothetical protein
VFERAGNAYLYRFNRDHLAAGPILELARPRLTLLSADRRGSRDLAVAAGLCGGNRFDGSRHRRCGK